MEILKDLEGKLRESLKGIGYDLYLLKCHDEKKEKVLEIVVDRELPISMDDIVKVSDFLNPLLDELDPFKEPYTLDVSSLGAEKPLDVLSLEKYVGKHVALHLKNPYKGENELEGDLKEADAEKVLLLVRDKSRTKEIELLRKDVDKGHLAIKF